MDSFNGWFLAGAFPASWVLTGLIRLLSLRFAILDIPNRRSSHTIPTPRGGGLAIVVVFLAGLAGIACGGHDPWPGFTLPLLLAALLVAGVGFWDDLRHLSPLWRLIAHCLAAGLVVWGLEQEGAPVPFPVAGRLPGLLMGAVLVLAVVWFLNLFNFMDGIDGLAGGEGLFVAGAAAGLLIWRGATAEALVPLLLALACLGFLLWNWPPARIFMGDVGSGFLGLVLAALALRSAVYSDLLPVAVWLILPGVFLVDATVTLVQRMVRGERWYAAHRSHAYQHAAVIYGSHLRVTLAVLAINLFWLLPLSVLCVIFPEFGLPLTLGAYLPLLVLAVKFKAGVEYQTGKVAGP